jgi:lysophospholipase L1-like esterase
VVIDIGNNGTLTTEQFDEMMRVLEDVRNVVFVNVKVPRTWEQPNNEVLAEGVRRYPNTVLVDWYAASSNRPDFFVDDGYHLQPEGQQVFADLIAAQTRAS